MSRRIAAGAAEPLGVTPCEGGINIAVHSARASAIELCLFDAAGERELERFILPARTGEVHHGYLADVPPGTRYGLRAHGRYAPEEGDRFNPAKLLVDPYALQLDRPFKLEPTLFAFRNDEPNSPDSRDDRDSAAAVPKGIVTDRAALAAPPTHVRVPWADTVVYEAHVRGYTKLHADIPEAIRGTFAALAHPAAIAHLTRLGITTLELMPAMAWIDERHLTALGLSNYWGYNPIALLAPDPRLAPGGWAEVRRATDALHAAGIEVVLDVVYNHSGESDEYGPTLSFRGLDNATYYRLVADAPQHYVNEMGCGNCLALDRPAVVRLAMDSMRAWVELGGIDGFRFDLATALGRRADGFDPAAPLIAAIEQDPVLRETKLIAEPWDLGPGGYHVGNFPAAFADWNDRFRDDVRRFWRGDAGARGALATRLAGSADLFAGKRRPSRGINFVVAHDGFTLADLVAYAGKHNEANGEHNRDGTDANFSWNNGVEGASADAAVNAARLRDQRNLLATLLLARGTPMLAMGAESGFSQGGNNNAYAQDNATTWLDWSRAHPGLLDTAARLIALRRAHPLLRADRFVDGVAGDASGVADIEWRSARAPLAGAADWERADPDTLVAALYDAASGERCALAFHRGAADIDIALPAPRDGHAWRRLFDSAMTDAPGAGSDEDRAETFSLGARSVAVFAEVAAASGGNISRAADDAALSRLASAAGIAAEWWDVDGTRHAVGADTQRHLLAAMGLPAATDGELRDSRERLAAANERRLLPLTRVVRAGDTTALRVAVDAASSAQLGYASVRDEAGTVVAHVAVAGFDLRRERDSLGRALRVGELPLPRLDAGRYTVAFDTAPEIVCRLTVAPPRCHRPALLDAAARGGAAPPFGLSVQAYSLRRADDFGIGDFSAIGEFAEGAARAGAATVGLNPLHMLFAQDRERASPYYPSDRRFLDPLYLDPDALADLSGFADAQALWRADPVRKELAARDTIDYPAVWARKSVALEALYAAFARFVRAQPNAPLAREFAAFVDAGGETLRRFATFQAIAQAQAGTGWSAWPSGLRAAHGCDVAAFAAAHEERVRYHGFLQWLCDRQLAQTAAQAAGLALGLYRDLAVGAAPDGAEAWANAHLLAHAVSIGAPPDPLAPQGQVWGLPPPNPLAWREHDFSSFGEAVAANMRHAGILRIDHALGLARLFWVPRGGAAADGAYVSYPLDDLLGRLALESARARCAVVGEDLGTVPDGLREKLVDHGVLRYQVLLLERAGLDFRSPKTYSPDAVACACTHDLPPLAGWWAAEDIREREPLGLISAQESARQLVERGEEKRLLLAALARDGIALHCDLDAALDADAEAALYAWLGQAPSALLLAQAEDLAGETVGQNLPGTDRERANWRRRLAVTSAELFASDRARRALAALRSRASRGDQGRATDAVAGEVRFV